MPLVGCRQVLLVELGDGINNPRRRKHVEYHIAVQLNQGRALGRGCIYSEKY